MENGLEEYLPYLDVKSGIMSILRLPLACLYVYIWYCIFIVEKNCLQFKNIVKFNNFLSLKFP